MKTPTITGHTKLTALLGSPVAHSISPLMHNEAFRQLGLDYVYLCFDVNEQTLPTTVAGLKAAGIRGFNLTMPNKNKIIDLVDHLSPAAQLIGAVNTVVNDNGILTGHNTDGTGFIQSLKDLDFSIVGKTITILGSGGAATAIAAQAALDGAAQIHIFARPSSRFWLRTQSLTDAINRTTTCQATLNDTNNMPHLRTTLTHSHLLVNATSVGMHPATDASPIEDPTMFHKELLVSDIIYNPRQTKLLKLANQSGCQTTNGLYMLLHQGAEAFKLFTDHAMPIESIRQKYFQ